MELWVSCTRDAHSLNGAFLASNGEVDDAKRDAANGAPRRSQGRPKASHRIQDGDGAKQDQGRRKGGQEEARCILDALCIGFFRDLESAWASLGNTFGPTVKENKF